MSRRQIAPVQAPAWYRPPTPLNPATMPIGNGGGGKSSYMNPYSAQYQQPGAAGWADPNRIQQLSGAGGLPADPASAAPGVNPPQNLQTGGYVSPYNMTGTAALPTTMGTAAPMPAAPAAPAVDPNRAAKVAEMRANQARHRAYRPSYGGNIGLARAAAQGLNYTHIPWAAGQSGNYMPGHGFQDQQNAKQTLNLMASQAGLYNPLVTRMGGGGGGGGYSIAYGYGGGGAGGNGFVGGGGGGAAAGGYGGGRGGLAGAYQSAMDAANAANETRYQQGLREYQDRYNRNLNDIKQSGSQEAKDIDEAATNQAAAARQSLASRGLTSSTVLDSSLAGVERDRVANQGRLQDRLRQQRVATDAQLSGEGIQYMERKNETGPDYNQMLQLAQGLGAGGVGAGGLGGGVDYVSPYQMGFQNPMAMMGMGGGMGRGGGGGMIGGVPMGGGATYTTADGRVLTGLTPAQLNMAQRRDAAVSKRNTAAAGRKEVNGIVDAVLNGTNAPSQQLDGVLGQIYGLFPQDPPLVLRGGSGGGSAYASYGSF